MPVHGKDGFKLDENGLRKGFEYFDQNRNGTLSKDELHAILTNKRSGNAFGAEEGKKVAEDIIKRFAKTNGQELEYEEVRRFALRGNLPCPRDDFELHFCAYRAARSSSSGLPRGKLHKRRRRWKWPKV
eukprot:3930228-Prymnesium_polylepis.1